MNCKCGNIVPVERINLGYSTCLDCSTIQKYGAVDIVYHKTGNTIDIMDSQSAQKLNKLAKRSGFGTMRGISKGNKRETYNPKETKHKVAITQIGNEQNYERIGAISVDEYFRSGLNNSFNIIEKAVLNFEINKNQSFKLKCIIEAIHRERNPPKEEEVIRWHNVEFSEKLIDKDGIDYAFRNWKIGKK